MIDQLDDSTSKKIKDHYVKGEGSIQDIARTYRVTVETVLHIIGEDELTSVHTIGDQVDADEAGDAQLNYYGTKQSAKFSTD